MSTIDYSKFEKLTKELDKEERYEKEQSRTEARDRYMKEQREKQIKWEEDMRRQGKDPEKIKANMSSCGCAASSSFMSDTSAASSSGHNHNHNHNHSHNHNDNDNDNDNDNHNHNHHDHDHDHNQEHNNSNHNHLQNNTTNAEKSQSSSSNEPPVSFNKPSCGYMPIEEIKRLQKENESKPQLSIQEKNKKKEEAVKATREDGNRIFKEGNYELAFKVYERGVMIINGMQNMTDEKCEEMENLESLLDLNMALCKLKLKEYTECIDLCKMSIQLNDKNPKAYYRWAEALIEMGEYEQARLQCMEAAKHAPESDKACPKLLEKIDKLHAIQIQKQKEHQKKLAAKLTKKQLTG